MKIKIEPEKFIELMNAGMLHNKGNPLVDPLTISCTSDGMLIKDNYALIIGVYIKIQKEFFKAYEVGEDELVTIPSVLVKTMGWKSGFGDKEVEIYTGTDNKIHVDGKTTRYAKEIEVANPQDFPFEMVETDYGFIPKTIKVESSADIKAEDLVIPSAKDYRFKSDGKTLTVEMESNGNLSHDFQAKIIDNKPIELLVNGEYYNAIIGNLKGNIRFILHKDMIILIEKNEEYTKVFIVGTMVEE